MATETVMLSQIAAQPQDGEAVAEEETNGFGKRPKPVGEAYVAPNDHELAIAITQAIAQLQDAMDAAVRARLIIEPSFKTVSGRLNEFGVSVDSHICNVQIYRKLA